MIRELSIACCVLLVASASPARADPKRITVDATQCADLDSERVERVLAIELAEVTTHATRTLTVRMSCSVASMVRIAVDDPVTGKELSREVPAPAANEPGRERALGLAASQLFLASWLELLSPTPPPSRPADARDDSAEVAARLLARRIVLPPQPPPHRLEIVALMGGAVRTLDDLPALVLGLGARVWIAPRFALLLDPSFITAGFKRHRGEAHAYDVLLSAGVGLRVFPERMLDLGAELRVAGGYGWVSAQSTDGVSIAGATAGPALDVQLGAGPTLRASRVVASLRVIGGITLLSPVGKIVGESDATLAGGYIGLCLELGFNLGE